MSINGGEKARVNILKVNEHGNVRLRFSFFLLLLFNRVTRPEFVHRQTLCEQIQHHENYMYIYLVLCIPFNDHVHRGNIRNFS